MQYSECPLQEFCTEDTFSGVFFFFHRFFNVFFTLLFFSLVMFSLHFTVRNQVFFHGSCRIALGDTVIIR